MEDLSAITQKGDLEHLFDAAEGMALATDQRESWQTERGVPIEAQTVSDWELDL